MSLDWILLALRLLAALLLYAFLSVAFYLLWRDLKQTERGHAVSAADSGLCLRVMAAPAEGNLETGQTLSLRPDTFLGRDSDNTIVLDDPAASGRHARLSRRDGLWWLEDLDSRNGTLLNELPLSKPTSLTEGDIIGLGSVRLRLVLGQAQRERTNG